MSIADYEFFEVAVVGDVTVVTLVDVTDQGYQPETTDQLTPRSLDIWRRFEKDLLAVLDGNKPAKVVLDFAALDQIGYQAVISSAMNGVFAQAKRASDSFRCQWRICGLTEKARHAYEVSSLHMIFPKIHDDQSKALAAFSESAEDST